jgi:hypothetical protein
MHCDRTSIQDACKTNQRENRRFHCCPRWNEVLEIAPRLEERREGVKQFVTNRVFVGMSRCGQWPSFFQPIGDRPVFQQFSEAQQVKTESVPKPAKRKPTGS